MVLVCTQQAGLKQPIIALPALLNLRHLEGLFGVALVGIVGVVLVSLVVALGMETSRGLVGTLCMYMQHVTLGTTSEAFSSGLPASPFD